jgi:hypothetical protein
VQIGETIQLFLCFESRWGRTLSPTFPRTFLSGSKLGSKIGLDHLAFAHVDLELCDLGAQRRPGEGRVHVDDVAARPVRDRLQEIAARAVDLSERHERSAKVVATAATQLQGVEIETEGVLRVGARPLGKVPRRDDDVVRLGASAIVASFRVIALECSTIACLMPGPRTRWNAMSKAIGPRFPCPPMSRP